MNRILSLLSTKQPPAQGELTVEGMTCGGCARRVESMLSKTAGVQEARVDLASRTVSVRWDPKQTSLQSVAQTLTAAGYRATPAAAQC